MAQLINNIYETGDWPRDFIEVTINDLKENTKATKFSDERRSHSQPHCTCSKMVPRLHRRRFEKKSEDVFGKAKFGFRLGKEIGLQVGC
jgi:hypothetical protein